MYKFWGAALEYIRDNVAPMSYTTFIVGDRCFVILKD